MEDSQPRFPPPLRYSDLRWTEQIENKFSRARHSSMYIVENKPCETTCQNRFAMPMNFIELSEAFLTGTSSQTETLCEVYLLEICPIFIVE